jgi:hypothetical protein
LSVGVVRKLESTGTRTKTKSVRVVRPWPPAALALPSTIEAIEAGRIVQAELFPAALDQDRAGRIARLLATPGVKLAANMAPAAIETAGA